MLIKTVFCGSTRATLCTFVHRLVTHQHRTDCHHSHIAGSQWPNAADSDCFISIFIVRTSVWGPIVVRCAASVGAHRSFGVGPRKICCYPPGWRLNLSTFRNVSSPLNTVYDAGVDETYKHMSTRNSSCLKYCITNGNEKTWMDWTERCGILSITAWRRLCWRPKDYRTDDLSPASNSWLSINALVKRHDANDNFR